MSEKTTEELPRAQACGCGVWLTGNGRHLTHKCELHRRARYYVRSCIVEAYQLPDGKWKVYGPNWLKEATFEDEDFHKNFVQI